MFQGAPNFLSAKVGITKHLSLYHVYRDLQNNAARSLVAAPALNSGLLVPKPMQLQAFSLEGNAS